MFKIDGKPKVLQNLTYDYRKSQFIVEVSGQSNTTEVYICRLGSPNFPHFAAFYWYNIHLYVNIECNNQQNVL